MQSKTNKNKLIHIHIIIHKVKDNNHYKHPKNSIQI
jgi:hypothetical protein